MDMYCYILCVNNLVAMVTIYMVNFVTQWQKGEEKGHTLFHFYNINHRNTVFICRSTTPLFNTAILLNIQLIWLPWQSYMVNLMFALDFGAFVVHSCGTE